MYEPHTPFHEAVVAMQSQVERMVDGTDRLYEVAVDKDALWTLYLKSFPEGTNPIFRTRTAHDCSACRKFIKTFGGVVAIKNGVVSTIWGFWPQMVGRYADVARTLDMYVRSKPVRDVFLTATRTIGTEKTRGLSESGEVVAWEHLNVSLPESYPVTPGPFMDRTRGEARAQKDVFKRSLEAISESSIDTVLELISTHSLYRGDEWAEPLRRFRAYVHTYQRLNDETAKHLYAWEHSGKAGPVISRIRNHSIGVLLTDITEGIDLEKAVRKYEVIVAPANYKRPNPVLTENMVKDAEKMVTELGYLPSLGRRFATMDDISVDDILFVDRDVAPRLKGGNVFDDLARTVPKKFGRLDEVSLDVFVNDVLPTAQKIEILLEPRHSPNLVSLIAPIDDTAPSMFKWPNGFSWAYNYNLADSMKQRVKAAGGNVDAVLRFSIQWNDAGDNNDDLDAHCIEPDGYEIYFETARWVHSSSGILDVDIIYPRKDPKAIGGVAVENIVWSKLDRMPEGVYKLFVHCFTSRGAKSGFSAEVEFDDHVYSFAYNHPLRPGEQVPVAEVKYDKKTGFTLTEQLSPSLATRNLWGLDTGQFHPVSVIMYSPNYWGGEGVGNRHIFFMLDGCTNPGNPNGFFNEYLKNELLDHKRVFEALGSKMCVTDSDTQLAGLGFSTTIRNEVTVRVTGAVTRLLNIKI